MTRGMFSCLQRRCSIKTRPTDSHLMIVAGKDDRLNFSAGNRLAQLLSANKPRCRFTASYISGLDLLKLRAPEATTSLSPACYIQT